MDSLSINLSRAFKESNAKCFDFFGRPLLTNAITNHLYCADVNTGFHNINQNYWLDRIAVTCNFGLHCILSNIQLFFSSEKVQQAFLFLYMNLQL